MYFSPERNTRFAQRLFEHVRNGTTDQTADMLPYDLSIYADASIGAAERTHIFEKLPMMAVHSSQLPETGDFVTVQLNRSQVIVARQKDGSVKALINACRHRGATLVKQESGRRNLFVCPYHGWSYAGDGTLKAISFSETFGACRTQERHLVELPVQERHGFVWIVEDPSGSIDMAAHLGPQMDALLADYHLDRYHVWRSATFEFAQNWKIMLEGVLDGYHVSFVHGATIKPYFYLNMMAIEDFGHHHVTATPRRTIDRILHEPPGQSPLDDYAVFGNLVSPNTTFVLHPHHIEHWTIYQNPGQNADETGRCRAVLRILTPQRQLDERGEAIMQKNWKIASAAILNEDVPVGDSIQVSANMPHAGPVLLGLNEVGNRVFHRAWRHYMQIQQEAPR
ncbi:aromatic ring-hydroxylating oxygenase subunit alpha [Paraburkholderia bannensis]|uniref:aromatic ring-hydroxylating oxygenase subunit alpha n=1 Tax=Paraburkholderia bannensis TaxID=765414 RepID=UPI002AC33112|nr:aromatic ring-hydroxylating dioxygenase subunit alpha [Paraburkholderia bannensis]